MIITQTPLRISFFGGGTDYPEHFVKHGGAVLGTAVDKSQFLSMSQFYAGLFDYSLRVAYRTVECVNCIDELQHAPFRECLRRAGVTHGVELSLAAELPSFTGLGSSSSFVVGLLNTIYRFKGQVRAPLELAYEAVDIERNVLGESVGCQDQTFAAVGGFNVIEFRAQDDFRIHSARLSPARQAEFDEHLLVVFTGIKRRAEDLAAAQVKRVGLNRTRLAAMRAMVDEGYRILTDNGPLARFGDLLHKGWMLKRELATQMTNNTIDEIYDAGCDAGALGGKLLGAGGGGFVLFFVPPEKRAAVRARLAHLPEVEFRTGAAGTRLIHSEPSHATLPLQPLTRAA